MNPKNDRKQSRQPQPAETAARPRRFRIEKLEERIAPRGKGYHSGGHDRGSCWCS